MMLRRPTCFAGLVCLVALALWNSSTTRADDWLPVTPEELAMKNYPSAPGTHAVILYKEIHTDDVMTFENHYIRIKILTEQGRTYANVEIPYTKTFRARDIKARTIRPNGSIVEFKGEVFDKVLVKARGLKVHTKSFTFPEAEVGSIIEYRYAIRWDTMVARSPDWIVQDELPIRRARFSFKPYAQASVAWTTRLPAGVSPKEEKGRVISLQMHDIPAFVEEELIPPEKELKQNVRFFYFRTDYKRPEDFWKDVGKSMHSYVESYIGKRKGVQTAAAQMVGPTDSEQVKLQKIYARVQQVRNLSYERSRTEQEEKREKIKENDNVEDVLKHNYGYRTEITRLFVALARAAGFEATPVLVSERDVQFFSDKLLDVFQLDGEVAMVRVGGQETYFDPGTPDCPFGMLAWLRSGVQGMKLSKDGGTFIVTPQPSSANAVVERKGALQLDPEGTLRGKMTVSFIGLEAISRRLSNFDEDDVGRRKDIEDEIKGWLPAGATVKLESITGWEGYDKPLQAEFTLEISGFGVQAGRRYLVPTNVFQLNEKNPFASAKRVHPVYFRNPFREVDDFTIELPEGYRVESAPAPRQDRQPFGGYQISRSPSEHKVRVQRQFVVDGFFFPVEYYGVLRSFYGNVRNSDEEQIVLQAAAPR